MKIKLSDIKEKICELIYEFDKNSIMLNLWGHFLGFAVLLLGSLWILQVLFLNMYYQDMKIDNTKDVAAQIEDAYGSDFLMDKMRELSASNDMYIHIETKDAILFTTSDDARLVQTHMYIKEMGQVREALLLGDVAKDGSASMRISEKFSWGEARETLAYAKFLGDPKENVILYIFSPLYPVDSTVEILAEQLMQVTVISLVLAFILACYLAIVISKPIKSMKKTAEKLAQGQYGVEFEEAHYTEVQQLARTLNMTSKELEKTENLRKDLIANVSHDLKTPLTMVKSYAEMIRDLSGENPVKRNEHLQVIIEEADRLNLIVNDMLDLSRMQNGVIGIEKSCFDLCKSLRSTIGMFEIYESSEGYSFKVETPAQEVLVEGDENQINRVITNLFNNAIKYCGEDKEIIVKVTEHDGWAKCEFIDHGMGIPQEELEQIWERYYKSSTNHVRSTKGTGLGLSIVKEIVKLHDGRCGVSSEIGKGSVFYFELEKR